MKPKLIADAPIGFGYKCQWLAVRDRDPRTVAEALGLTGTTPATWKDGLDRAYERARYRAGGPADVFITPPVRGWTLAVGGMGVIPWLSMPEFVPFLSELSARLGHVQYFGNHRVSCCAGWAKAIDGRLVRLYCAEESQTCLEIGDPTPDEIALGFDFLRRGATPAEVEAHEAKLEADRLLEQALREEFEAMGAAPEACGVSFDDILVDRDATPAEDEERRARFRADRLRIDAFRGEIRSVRAAIEARGEPFDDCVLDEIFPTRFDFLVPNEDTVMMLAGRWSVDPTRLEESGLGPELGLGLIGAIRERPSRGGPGP